MKILKPNKQLTQRKRGKALKEWETLQEILDTKQNPNSVIDAYNKKWSGIAIIIVHAGKTNTILFK